MKAAIFLAPLMLCAGTAVSAQTLDHPRPDNPNRDWQPADSTEDRDRTKDHPDYPPAPAPGDPEVKPDNPYPDPRPADPNTDA